MLKLNLKFNLLTVTFHRSLKSWLTYVSFYKQLGVVLQKLSKKERAKVLQYFFFFRNTFGKVSFKHTLNFFFVYFKKFQFFFFKNKTEILFFIFFTKLVKFLLTFVRFKIVSKFLLNIFFFFTPSTGVGRIFGNLLKKNFLFVRKKICIGKTSTLSDVFLKTFLNGLTDRIGRFEFQQNIKFDLIFWFQFFKKLKYQNVNNYFISLFNQNSDLMFFKARLFQKYKVFEKFSSYLNRGDFFSFSFKNRLTVSKNIETNKFFKVKDILFDIFKLGKVRKKVYLTKLLKSNNVKALQHENEILPKFLFSYIPHKFRKQKPSYIIWLNLNIVNPFLKKIFNFRKRDLLDFGEIKHLNLKSRLEKKLIRIKRTLKSSINKKYFFFLRSLKIFYLKQKRRSLFTTFNFFRPNHKFDFYSKKRKNVIRFFFKLLIFFKKLKSRNIYFGKFVFNFLNFVLSKFLNKTLVFDKNLVIKDRYFSLLKCVFFKNLNFLFFIMFDIKRKNKCYLKEFKRKINFFFKFMNKTKNKKVCNFFFKSFFKNIVKHKKKTKKFSQTFFKIDKFFSNLNIYSYNKYTVFKKYEFLFKFLFFFEKLKIKNLNKKEVNFIRYGMFKNLNFFKIKFFFNKIFKNKTDTLNVFSIRFLHNKNLMKRFLRKFYFLLNSNLFLKVTSKKKSTLSSASNFTFFFFNTFKVIKNLSLLKTFQYSENLTHMVDLGFIFKFTEYFKNTKFFGNLDTFFMDRNSNYNLLFFFKFFRSGRFEDFKENTNFYLRNFDFLGAFRFYSLFVKNINKPKVFLEDIKDSIIFPSNYFSFSNSLQNMFLDFSFLFRKENVNMLRSIFFYLNSGLANLTKFGVKFINLISLKDLIFYYKSLFCFEFEKESKNFGLLAKKFFLNFFTATNNYSDDFNKIVFRLNSRRLFLTVSDKCGNALLKVSSGILYKSSNILKKKQEVWKGQGFRKRKEIQKMKFYRFVKSSLKGLKGQDRKAKQKAIFLFTRGKKGKKRQKVPVGKQGLFLTTRFLKPFFLLLENFLLRYNNRKSLKLLLKKEKLKIKLYLELKKMELKNRTKTWKYKNIKNKLFQLTRNNFNFKSFSVLSAGLNDLLYTKKKLNFIFTKGVLAKNIFSKKTEYYRSKFKKIVLNKNLFFSKKLNFYLSGHSFILKKKVLTFLNHYIQHLRLKLNMRLQCNLDKTVSEKIRLSDSTFSDNISSNKQKSVILSFGRFCRSLLKTDKKNAFCLNSSVVSSRTLLDVQKKFTTKLKNSIKLKNKNKFYFFSNKFLFKFKKIFKTFVLVIRSSVIKNEGKNGLYSVIFYFLKKMLLNFEYLKKKLYDPVYKKVLKTFLFNFEKNLPLLQILRFS